MTAPPIRVLFVNRMASMVRGGGETFDLEMARHLQALGCRVSLLTGLPLLGRAKSPVQWTGDAHTIRTPYTGWFPWDKVRGGWRLRLADFYLFEKRAAAWASRRRDRFDVIQVCELPTFVRTWKRRPGHPPVVMRFTAPDYHDEAGAVGEADAIVASGTTIRKLRNGVRPDCVDIPNGVDTDRFRPQPSDFRPRRGIAEGDFVILYVARFQTVKNHRMVITAFRRFLETWPEAWLVLVGSGPLEADIRAACRKLEVQDRVQFLGEVPYDQLPAIYAAADVKVIASFYESFCFAALEAMASGLALVVTDTDWVPTLIELGEGGRVVPKDDALELARHLLDLAAHPDQRRRMGQHNRRKVVEQFQWASSAGKLLGLYEQLRGRSGPAS
jgi:glycosyltransferase involved in cell wall biosynthesis